VPFVIRPLRPGHIPCGTARRAGTTGFIEFDAASAIKVTIPRPVISGDIDDTDVFGGQQYGPLVDLEVPEG